MLRLAVDKEYHDHIEETLGYMFRSTAFNNEALRSRYIAATKPSLEKRKQGHAKISFAPATVSVSKSSSVKVGDDELLPPIARVPVRERKKAALDIARKTLEFYRTRVTAAPRAKLTREKASTRIA